MNEHLRYMLLKYPDQLSVRDVVAAYYDIRGLRWPNFEQAILFVITELAEASELHLARTPFVRNNSKEPFNKERLAEELGDALMMILVAGIVEGVDPAEALREKICRKISESGEGRE